MQIIAEYPDKKIQMVAHLDFLSGYSDSNGGPPAPKAGALANCATSRLF